MSEINMITGAMAAVLLGVLSHQLYFKRGEHHMYAVKYVQLFAAVFIGSIFALTQIRGVPFAAAFTNVSLFAVSWLIGVYSSLLAYRILFHPLKKFPGDWRARIGNLWFSAQVTDHNAYHVLYALHQKYGPYVRIGSNDLSIVDPSFMPVVFGLDSKVTKGEWYDGPSPHDSMHTTRNRGLHDRRRRVWAPAFSDKALREYEPTIDKFNAKLVQRIAEHKGGVINVTKWFNLYGFDVMGQLAFGKDYAMLDSGERHWALDLLTEGMETASRKLPTWVFRVLVEVPGLVAGYLKFLNFCTSELKSRIARERKGTGKDITAWLLRAYEGDPNPGDDPLLQGDARLIIVAGSDTTSATLTHMFFHLAKDPRQVQKLREELKPLTKGDWSDKDIQDAPHLSGVINETLRLHPAVPSGLHRLTPPEGMRANNTFIPGGVNFWMPQYIMGRDESIYEDATSFVPERWYSKSHMVKQPDAFAPFSMGPFNCIGRNLARKELRTLTTRLVLAYDVALAPNEDGTRLLTKTKDHFTTTPAPLDLVFTPASS